LGGIIVKVLVVNVGSTSLKFKMLEMPEEREVCSGKIDRVGSAGGSALTAVGLRGKVTRNLGTMDYSGALKEMLRTIAETSDESHGLTDISAVGFKTVHARGITGTALLDEDVLQRMEDFICVAPAHNPPYLRAIRAMREVLPRTPLVGVFEAHFHSTIPLSIASYGLPPSFYERGLRRYGFHGASHHYISERVQRLVPGARRVVSCHLGGSSSVCAILDGKSVDTSMGFSPQTGLLQSTRPGDLDPYVVIYLMKREGYSIEDVEALLGQESGLLGVSQLSGEMSDVLKAANSGNSRASLAVQMYCASLCRYIGAYAALLGGLDVLVFTGGIGENSAEIRQAAVEGLDFMGVEIDPELNAHPCGETLIGNGKCKTYVIPTNEEIIVAREVAKLLSDAWLRVDPKLRETQ
jgi:acetate kinase